MPNVSRREVKIRQATEFWFQFQVVYITVKPDGKEEIHGFHTYPTVDRAAKHIDMWISQGVFA